MSSRALQSPRPRTRARRAVGACAVLATGAVLLPASAGAASNPDTAPDSVVSGQYQTAADTVAAATGGAVAPGSGGTAAPQSAADPSSPAPVSSPDTTQYHSPVPISVNVSNSGSGPVNVNVSVRVGSPGDDGPVSQTNAPAPAPAASTPPAAAQSAPAKPPADAPASPARATTDTPSSADRSASTGDAKSVPNDAASAGGGAQPLVDRAANAGGAPQSLVENAASPTGAPSVADGASAADPSSLADQAVAAAGGAAPLAGGTGSAPSLGNQATGGRQSIAGLVAWATGCGGMSRAWGRCPLPAGNTATGPEGILPPEVATLVQDAMPSAPSALDPLGVMPDLRVPATSPSRLPVLGGPVPGLSLLGGPGPGHHAASRPVGPARPALPASATGSQPVVREWPSSAALPVIAPAGAFSATPQRVATAAPQPSPRRERATAADRAGSGHHGPVPLPLAPSPGASAGGPSGSGGSLLLGGLSAVLLAAIALVVPQLRRRFRPASPHRAPRPRSGRLERPG